MAGALGARLNPGESLGDRVIKVDHAGEHGAVSIYRWQRALSTWRSPALVPELDDFLAHERHHRALFASELARRNRPRCRSYHLCALGGACLGIVTAIIGPRAVHATTRAIERVVLRHLEDQRVALEASDPDAVRIIEAILSDEQDHHDKAASHLAGRHGWLERAIDRIVGASTEAVIWIGMKL